MKPSKAAMIEALYNDMLEKKVKDKAEAELRWRRAELNTLSNIRDMNTMISIWLLQDKDKEKCYRSI